MDCVNCLQCHRYESHLWRFQCTTCWCPCYFHKSFARMRMKLNDHQINWTDNVAANSISQLGEYQETMKLAARKRLMWLPIGLEEMNVQEFLVAHEAQIGPLNNECFKEMREMKIVLQIPIGDCNMNSAGTPVDKIEFDLISESEYNFKKNRDSNYFGFGVVIKPNNKEICLNCRRHYCDTEKFCLRISHSSTASWHLSCFKCFSCQEHLVDFHYCWSVEHENVFCLKHFDNLSYARCGACDQLIFHNSYVMANEKEHHVEHLACKECDQPFTENKYILMDESPFCLTCYDKKFASLCDRCSEKISCDSKDVTFDDRHWHDKCFHCDNCKDSLVDLSFARKEKEIYCQTCYDAKFAVRCNRCGEAFTPGIKKFDYNGSQWHEECFLCSECEQSIGGNSFIPKDGKVLCIKCYEEKHAKKCTKCKETIRKGGITYKSEPWHKECLLCTQCNKELANTKFTSKEDKPYCSECFADSFSKRCKKCDKPISGFGACKFISLEDDNWHTECFICTKCEINLVGTGFIIQDLKVVCATCGQNEANEECD